MRAPGLPCPDCGSTDIARIVSDEHRTSDATWHRFRCDACNRAFGTVELRADSPRLLARASIDELFAELRRRCEARDGGE